MVFGGQNGAKGEQVKLLQTSGSLWTTLVQLSLLWPGYSSPWVYLAAYKPSAVVVGSQLP